MILKNRIKQLEAEKADLQAALEACVRAMEQGSCCRVAEWLEAFDGASALLRHANQNDDRTRASPTQVSPEQKA